MAVFTLAEARHYLQERGVERGIFELKGDILRGKLRAKKIGNRYWVSPSDLDDSFDLSVPAMTGEMYFTLRKSGKTREELLPLLTRQYGNEGKARRVSRSYEAHITMGTYEKKAEHKEDISQSAAALRDRAEKVRLRTEKLALGLYTEAEQLESEMPRTVVLGVVRKKKGGLAIQLPVTPEGQAEPGLLSSLYSFFVSPDLYQRLEEAGIEMDTVTAQDGCLVLNYRGNRHAIMRYMREHLSSQQPAGFSEANLEVRLFMPTPLLLEEIKLESTGDHVPGPTSHGPSEVAGQREGGKVMFQATEREGKPMAMKTRVRSRLYTWKQLHEEQKMSQQKLAALVRHGRVKKVTIGADVYYRM